MFVGRTTLIKEFIKDKKSIYFLANEEPNFLLKNEVEKPITYFSILKCIAAGNHKMGNISADLSIPSAKTGKYLHILRQLDIIGREVPVTEDKPEKSKKGLYYIKDNFIEFWFKFIFPYNAYLEMDRYQYVLDVIQRNLIDNHTAFIFEKVCSELLWNMQLPFVPLKVGRWWNANNEIDVVGINSFENCIIFGECKFWNKKIGMNILISLKEKAKQVKCLKKDRKEYFILFSKLGFNEDLIEAEKRGEVILYSLH